MRRSALILLLVASLVAPVARAAELPRLEGLRYEWVARNMLSNGVPLEILGFSGEMSVAQVLGFYHDQWRRSGVAPQQQRQGGWQVLSAREERTFVSVTVRRRGLLVEGYLLRSHPERLSNSRASNIPLPPGVRIIARQDYIDAGRRGETLTLASPQQPATLAIGFEQTLRSSGWQVTRAGRATTTANGYRAEYVSSAGDITLFVHRDTEAYDGQSLALVHFLGRDG